MKPRRHLFRAPAIFSTPLRYGTPVFIGLTIIATGLSDAWAGDLLRGGSSSSRPKPGRNTAAGADTPDATDAARANAKDTLARTNRTLDAMRAMQNAARNAALANGTNNLGKNPNNLTVTLPKVPNGLGVGGLNPTIDPTKWTGANAAVQTVKNGKTQVTIKQTTQQALLEWQTLNVGKNTTLTFDQSKGGENSAQWIAFNKITDPSGNPTQILGHIKADGQIYLINPNGIIFGGGSQVNARGLTASSLPINENLIQRSLLNNPDAQFLFSGLTVPGGADGTPIFDPGPLPASGKYGDVIVQEGAVLKSPAGSGGNGGRIMLVGPNVTNNGTISTESGQTILAAGLQVGVAAHNGSDPSLRGLDVWVGDVGSYGGTATNTGIVEAYTGSTWMTGKNVNQFGAIESSTSVNLNGRIDLKASYGAVGNPNFDSATELGGGGPMFFNQFTGVVTLGENSVTQILPDYASKKSVPGLSLPERSQVNIDGLAIHFDTGSIMLAPNAEVNVRAGSWPYKDADGNRSVFDEAGKVESGLSNFYSGEEQRFFFDNGQIYIDDSAIISVAGSTDVFVPLEQSILKVKLLGSELADSPLLRDTNLRGQELTVDLRNSGVYNGKYWIGTPLGDVTGLAGLIERNAAQLTAAGGNINLQAGGSIVVSKTSTLDVSGGYFRHEGGIVNTSALMSGGRLVSIDKATPDQTYDGIFTGSNTFTTKKWGVSKTFDTPLFSGTMQESFVEGAAGGTLSITAPSMALDGKLRGLTVEGPRQRSTPPGLSTLKINFESEKAITLPGTTAINFIKYSPTPPAVVFSKDAGGLSAPAFTLTNDAPVSLAADRIATVKLSPKLLGYDGFGALDISNPDGSITVPADVTLSATPKGSISFAAANISVLGKMEAVGGNLSFTTYNISPSAATEYNFLNPSGSVPLPDANVGRGIFTLAKGASLSTAGLLVDDSLLANEDLTKARTIDGGSISINSYQADLAKGSSLDVSGGAYISTGKQVTYGKAGGISILTGNDPAFAGVIGGGLVLDSTLSGYSGIAGGTLTIQAGLIRIGGDPQPDALNLDEGFFRKGGFAKYALSGIGAAEDATPPAGQFETYKPAISIAAGTKINPIARTYLAVQDLSPGGGFSLEKITDAKGVRPPVSLSFTALGSDDPFTLDKLEVRGDIFMGAGSAITTDAGGKVSFKGGTVTLLGSVIAPGGEISVAGAGSFPLTTSQKFATTQAFATVHIGALARLSTAGITQLVPDDFGRRVGKVYNGGIISVSGNILAESGAALDVSGTSGVLDLDPANLANPTFPNNSGLASTPLQQLGVATRIDSNGGTIDLTGSQMLLTDATLLGAAGGKQGTGGTLSVSSGRYYMEGESRTGADTNLIVQQSGNFILNPEADLGVGIALKDGDGNSYGGSGFFAIDRFNEGSFASLSLGGKYVGSAQPIPYGGNIDFHGKIDIEAKGSVRLAGGGVIRADDAVKISASYLSIGQDFRAPQHPDDVFLAFQQDPALPSSEYSLAPTFGSGSLDLSAGLIDVGTLSLQNIGRANLTAINGDIRGNGTLSMAGDLTLTAAQVYPTTLAKFDIFAYDHDGIKGSVTIKGAGKSAAPLSAGGSLSIYSSNIVQSGVLRAPLGTIRLGWDGTDLDKSDADIDAPRNLIAGSAIATPVTSEVTLTDDSLTSVSAKGLTIPYGISPDGSTWIDPRGVNITLSGMPEKAVFVSGDSVKMASGATIDIRGGGDLFASRWVPGNGGSRDLLGSASAEWGAGSEYQPGTLVTYKGETWSARVRNSGQTPGANLYWTKIPESFAIVPDYTAKYSPYGAYNTGANSGSLAGNPGYVSSSLKVGDTITLDASDGLPAGTYTLLPRAYAALKGAFLITPVDNGSSGAFKTADGATFVSGYTSNAFNQPESVSNVRSRFEVASADVIKNRVTYTLYSANDFISKAGGKQLLPTDAGYVAFQGNTALDLAGSLLTQASGRGASVDISSFSDIHLVGGDGAAPVSTQVALQTSVLDSWNADSLLIGGIRTRGADGTTVDVRTQSLTLDNPGDVLSGPEIILTSLGELTLTGGSSISSTGKLTGAAETLLVNGDGTLLRVSSDSAATVTRTGLTGSTAPLMNIGASASIAGPSVILDSTYGTILSPLAKIDAETLTMASGQISVVFDDATGALDGSLVSPHLTLAGVTLDKVQQSKSLTLQSYRSIDFYGTGTIGSSSLESLTLSGSGLRGYQQGTGQVVIRANDVSFENPTDATIATAPLSLTGGLTVDAETIHLGSNQSSVSGYQNLSLNASKRIVFEGTGGFSTAGDLTADSPLVTGAKGSIYSIISGGGVSLDGSGTAPASTGELGASLTIEGTSIVANTDILLPSGQLTLRATNGSLEVGGDLSVEGSSRQFNDLTRYSNAGTITLESVTGDVSLTASGTVSVAASVSGGDAGTLNVRAAHGNFTNAGSLLGQAGNLSNFNKQLGVGKSGNFLLDAGSLADSGKGSFTGISNALDAGGFFGSRNFRVRNGDITVSNVNQSSEFVLAADQGSILLTGVINASGKTGGSISLSAHNNLTIAAGSYLGAAGEVFNSAGKGGSILLEAGTQRDGVANTAALLDLQAGSTIDLSVGEYVAGSYTTPGSSAFEGKFTGTLHLRAPRTDDNTDLRIDSIESAIVGASSVVAEGYQVYTPTDGVLNIAQRNLINTDSISFLGAAGVGNANEAAMRAKLLTGADNASGLDSILVIAPGVEMINLTGDLTLGLANNLSTGTTNIEALAAADWDLSGFRYGSRSAAGVLTLRASGDLVFNNTLSDGFTPIAQGTAQTFADNGHSLMWLGKLMTIKDTLPINTQSWSYRLTAGADVNASNFRNVVSVSDLDLVQPLKGSVIVGEFYPPVPNSQSNGSAAGNGTPGQTADSIRISSSTTNRGNRFEVIRTGTGDITISAGRDVQLRNQFSTIYTAGVALPTPTTIYSANDFVVPVLPTSANNHPSQTGSGNTLGSIQQIYPATWSMAGGNVAIAAQADIGHYTLLDGLITVDSSRQMPTNWLYRRGYVDSQTGLFSADGGVSNAVGAPISTNITDAATSTTWWIDYSNFFEGVGALGGGNVTLTAGHDVVNVDAVSPTNARMPGRKANPDFNVVADAPEFINVAPDATKLVELGGGDVTVNAGRNIDGGAYYVERGKGSLFAGGSITTNASRSPSLGILDGSAALDPLTWLPTTLFVGKSNFDVAARGDILLGPISNPFLLPQGINNKFWYKTYFSTFAPDAGATVSSYGGSVTHRMAVTLPDSASSRPILDVWYNSQNLFAGVNSAGNASNYQPWLRLSEVGLDAFSGVFGLTAPNLTSTAFAGDINLVGSWTLFPSATGNLDLAAAGGIVGLQNAGPGNVNGRIAQVWTASTINVSDASPESIPSISTPIAYQSAVGRDRIGAVLSTVDILQNMNLALDETGSFKGLAGTAAVKQALHASGVLHTGDTNPVHLYATDGDITGLTLFTPKATRIIAERDITDVAFYMQNVGNEDITLISAGGDIIPFNENATIREIAGNISLGNAVGDDERTTVTGNSTRALAGDIQINGPGSLEVLAGRNVDLGNGANFVDGTGTGITSIGNSRNPSLSFGGADVITLAGLGAADGVGPADGLANSDLGILEFIKKYLPEGAGAKDSAYLKKIDWTGSFEDLSLEQQAIVTLEKFYKVLRHTGRAAAKKGDYKSGYAAIRTMFGKDRPAGEILTRAREIRTTTGGSISLGAAGGGITMASDIFGSPLTPPGIVTEYGGSISTFTNGDVNIGQARIFTLRGGDITMWSSHGNIAAGTSPKTVVTAPPTRVVLDITSADVQTDLGGLATGGGIGVLAAVEGVEAGNVDLVAPKGYVDAGDAGIRVTGNLNIAAQVVLNSSNISAGGSSTGTSVAAPSAPSIGAVVSAGNTAGAAGATAKVDENKPAEQKPAVTEELLSLITVDVIGYGEPGSDEDEKKKKEPTAE
ncbi:MAG: filamentous hemagglutinin family protein [Luteolibacter sp.]